MSRKFLVTIVLLLLLLPFVSWYYLRSGLQWRKQAQEGMKGTIPFPAISWTDSKGYPFSQDSVTDRVTLMSFLPCDDHLSNLLEIQERLFTQFKDTRKAGFLMLDTCRVSRMPEGHDDRELWYHIPFRDSLDAPLIWADEWPADKPFALIDRHGIIRSYYAINSPEEKRILVEHMALLLPRERQEKVELKRGNKK